MFGIEIDATDMSTTVTRMLALIEAGKRESALVFTPNVDHIIKLHEHAAFREAYADANVVVADGKPLVWASKLLRKPLPSVVPGSDLVPEIFDAAAKRGTLVKVYLFGAMAGVAELARDKIHAAWGPSVKVVGVGSPEFGFEHDQVRCQEYATAIHESGADILVIGLGAPKQELWAHKYRKVLGVNVVICAGATIDFLAGAKARAPKWVRIMALEWVYRTVQEPRRLAKRYAYGLVAFPLLVLRELLKSKNSS